MFFQTSSLSITWELTQIYGALSLRPMEAETLGRGPSPLVQQTPHVCDTPMHTQAENHGLRLPEDSVRVFIVIAIFDMGTPSLKGLMYVISG